MEDRQSANDFEDQIQDFVYVRHSDNGIGVPKDGRAKRQISDEFPDKIAEPPPPHMDIDQLRNTSDFFDNEIGPDMTMYIISGLKHYTRYAISIRACREKEDDETDQAIVCGHEVNDYVTTVREPAKDDIDSDKFFVTEIINGSTSDIRIQWEPPSDPNGLLLTYTIRYRRTDIDNTSPTTICLSYNKLNGTVYTIQKLPHGNYSVDIMATSLAGNGNYTRARSVLIKEKGGNTLWYAFAVLLSLFLICLAFLLLYIKRMYVSSISSMKIIATVNPDYAGVTYRQDEWEIPRDQIIQLQELGCGSFGKCCH